MSVSAEMYLVVSLMMAVFAAVAAVGTSVVLGAGFERLRAGFEIIKNQTGFFATAIHELDKRADKLEEQSVKMKESVNGMSEKVERVEKQTGFFSDAIHSLEQKILEGSAVQAITETQHVEDVQKRQPELSLPITWITSSSNDAMGSNEDHLLDERRQAAIEEHFGPDVDMPMPADPEDKKASSLASLLTTYFRSEGRDGKEIVYH